MHVVRSSDNNPLLITHLSISASLKKTKSNTQQECNKDKKTLVKYRHMEVTLDADQSDEMVEIMDKINTISKKTLEEIFTEAESSGVGGRGIWEDDTRNIKDLHTDQESVSTSW